MTSRRDLYQSYQFMMQRLVSGLVQRETDPEQTPLRKQGGAAFGGIMIAILALAAAGIIGVISPGGNTKWQDGGQVIVEKETGAKFVYLQDQDGDFQLHPVPNLTSGALLAGTSQTISVSASSLAEEPRAEEIGIWDAPDSLATPGRMLTDPWTLCSLPAETRDGRKTPNTALAIGQGPTAGSTVADTATVVRDIETGTLHLVWRGRGYPVGHESAVLEGLGLRGVVPVEVGTAWLSALPAGDTIAPVIDPAMGAPSKALAGATVGEIRVVNPDNNPQYYLVRAAEIQQLTEVQALVTLADPAVRDAVYGGAPAVAATLPAADANSAPRTPLPPADPADAPAEVPDSTPDQGAETTVCASFESGQPVPVISVQASVEGAEHAPATTHRAANGVVLADRVLIAGGHGTLVDSVVSPGAGAGSLFYISDKGVRFAIPNRDVLGALGYRDVAAVPMPAALVARVPEGSALDPEAAKYPV